MTLKDFKLENGDWAYRITDENGKRHFTRAGLLYHALKQRVNPNGRKQKDSPLYQGCYSTFDSFQAFSNWCQTQVGYLEGYHLDKDLITKDNKEYGEFTCLFIPQQLNKLITNRKRFRGELPIGVSRDKYGIRASCQHGTKIAKFLGYFKTPEEAFNAYKSFKENYIKEQAELWKDKIDPRAYNALMNYEVLITD
jgi:hypothetical protein